MVFKTPISSLMRELVYTSALCVSEQEQADANKAAEPKSLPTDFVSGVTLGPQGPIF